MEILALYHFKIQYRLEKKMAYADYLFHLYQNQTKYSLKELIQVFYKKVDKRKILYQVIYREIKEEIELYIILKYLIKDNRFNCKLYIINIIG